VLVFCGGTGTNINLFKRYAGHLRKAQQALSRMQKYKKNWKKAKTRVQRIHARIANSQNGTSRQKGTRMW
jgi:putative transposase